jgi:hypothetical protein
MKNLNIQDITFQDNPGLEPVKLLSMLKDYGVVLVEKYITPDTLEALNSEFDTFLSNPSNNYQERTPYADGRAARVHRSKIPKEIYPATSAVFSSEWMEPLASQYLGGSVELNKKIYVVNDVVGKRHIANDLHFDVLNSFKYFIYLTDTTAENGAFTCAPGSHYQSLQLRQQHGSKVSFEHREVTRDLPVEDYELISIEAPAGSLIIFDTDVFHRAGVVSSGERRVMRGHTRLRKEASLKGFFSVFKDKVKKYSPKV